MIEFACPGCTKTYEANLAFVGFETRCLRCGTVVRIPAKSGSPAAALANKGLPTKPRPSPNRPAPTPRPRPRLERVEDDIDFGAPIESNSNTATAMAVAPPRKTVRAEPAAPTQEPELKPAKSKKKVVIVGSVAGGVLLLATLGYAFSGGSPKPTPKQEPLPPQKQEEPVPTPPPPAPVARVYEPAPMPRAVRPPVENELTAAALLLEYGEAPAICDQKYAGRDLVVRGVFHQYRLGKVTLVATDEKSTPLMFTLLLPTELKPGELLSDPGLTPGQAVSLRGTYVVGCRFIEATVHTADSVANRAFLNQSVCIEGATIRAVNTPSGAVPFPSLVLEPPATDSKITVTCLFKVSELDDVMRLKPGSRIEVRGKCSGRSYTHVRLDNCGIVNPDNPPGPESLCVTSDSFFFDYESDLIAGTRVNLKNPATEIVSVTAEGLGHAYQVDPRTANAAFRNKAVQLSGIVKERHANTRMVVLQCGTDTTHSVAVLFSPAAYAAIPPEDKNLAVRGVCSGLAGGYVRIESAEYAETRTGADAMRTDIEYLPYRLGKEHIFNQIAPGRSKDSPVKRIAIRFAGDDLIQAVVLKAGTFPGTSLLKDPLPESKWYNAPNAKLAPILRRYRVRDGAVEIGQPYAMMGKEIQEFWEPVLKPGLKKGQSWSIRFPDGKMATYTVMDFTKSASGADQLELKRTLRDSLDPTRWEENGITYIRGVGEVRRIVSSRTERGEAIVMLESRMITDGSPEFTTPEIKSKP